MTNLSSPSPVIPNVLTEPEYIERPSPVLSCLSVNDPVIPIVLVVFQTEPVALNTSRFCTAVIKCADEVLTLTVPPVKLIAEPAEISNDTDPAVPPPVNPSPANTADISPVPDTLLASHLLVEEFHCNTCPLANDPVVTSLKFPTVDDPPPPALPKPVN